MTVSYSGWPPVTPPGDRTDNVDVIPASDHNDLVAAVSKILEILGQATAPLDGGKAADQDGGQTVDENAGLSIFEALEAVTVAGSSGLATLTARLDDLEARVPADVTADPVSSTGSTVPKIEQAQTLDDYAVPLTFTMSGQANSDVMLLLYGDSDGGVGDTLGVPAGWTKVGSTYTVGNVDMVACTRWGGDFNGSVTIGRGHDRAAGTLLRLSGVNKADIDALTLSTGNAKTGLVALSTVVEDGELLVVQAVLDGTVTSEPSLSGVPGMTQVTPTTSEKRGYFGYLANDSGAATSSLDVTATWTTDSSHTWVSGFAVALLIPSGTPSGYPTDVADPVTQAPSAVGGKWLSVNSGGGSNNYGKGPDTTFSDLITFKNTIVTPGGFFFFSHPGSSHNVYRDYVEYTTSTDPTVKGTWNYHGTSQKAPLNMWNHAIELLGVTDRVETHLDGYSWTISQMAAGSALPSDCRAWHEEFADQVDAWMTAHPTFKVVLRMFGEFNGDWADNVNGGSGSYWIGASGVKNSEFKTAWQRLHAAITARFTSANLANLLFCWAPMGWHTGQTSGTIQDPAGAYPGDAYVDVIAPDWYTHPNNAIQPLASKGGPVAYLDSTVDYMRTISSSKPVGIGEGGVGIPEADQSYPSGWSAAQLWADFWSVMLNKELAFFNHFYHRHYLSDDADWSLTRASAAEIAAYRNGYNAWIAA